MGEKADEIEVLLRLYEEERLMARHHAEQRTAVGNLLLTLDAGVLGLVTFLASAIIRDSGPQVLAIISIGIPGLLLGLFGITGMQFSRKHYERADFHLKKADAYLAALEMEVDVDSRWSRRSKEKHVEKHKDAFRGLRLWALWRSLHELVLLMGITLMVVAVAIYGNSVDWLR